MMCKYQLLYTQYENLHSQNHAMGMRINCLYMEYCIACGDCIIIIIGHSIRASRES